MPETKFNAVFVGVLDELQIECCEDMEPLVMLKLSRLPITDELQLPSHVIRPKDVHYKVVATGDWIDQLGRVCRMLCADTILYIEGQFIVNMWRGPTQQGLECVQSISDHGIEATYIAVLDPETLEVRPLEQLLDRQVELPAPSLWSSLRLWFRSRFLAPGA